MKARHLLILFIISFFSVITTSCERDEEGNFLAATYCTATVDGINFIDRIKTKLPGVYFGQESPYSIYQTTGPDEISDILPSLYIDTSLKSLDNKQFFWLHFYLRNIEPGKSLEGREITISATEKFSSSSSSLIYEIMARDKIDIVVMGTMSDPFTPCSGTVRINEYDAKSNSISGEFSLLADGHAIEGNFYKISLS